MKKSGKVLVITYYWPPSGGAGVQRTLKFVRFLPSFGFEPVVLTVDPDVASYPLRDESLLKEVPAGQRVLKTRSFEPLNFLAKVAGKEKVPYGGFSNTSDTFFQRTLRWVRGNFFIPDARVGWVNHAFREASRIIREENIDIVYISSPPHSSQLIGLKLKKTFPEVRWVADLRDPWTRIYYYKDLLHTPVAKRMDAKLEREVLQKCDHAIVVSEPIRRDFAETGNIDAAKISVIPNGYDEEDFLHVTEKASQVFIVTYTGTLAESYNPTNIFTAFRDFVNEMPPERNVLFRFVGSMPTSVRHLLTESGLDRYCEFIPYVPHARAVQYMQESHVNLLVIPDSPGAEGILTGKLFEYLGARKPVLGIGPVNGAAANIVNETRAGKFYTREDVKSVTEWLQLQYTAWSKGELKLNPEELSVRYTRKALTKELASVLLST